MIPRHFRRFFGASWSRAAVFAFVLAAFAIAACSSDPPSPLGDDLVASVPGVIFEDTLEIFADTTFAYATALASDSILEFGRVSGYQRSMIIQISFAGASSYVTSTVQSAVLRLTADDVDAPIPARFYRLTDAYAEGDSVPSLDTLAVVVDPDTGSPNRTLQTVPREYPIPPGLVQGWIRDEIERTALAIVYTDDTIDRIATFKALQAARDRPQLVVTFVGGATAIFRANGDATFVRPTTTTSNLVVSDGFVRRTYFRIPFDQLEDNAAIHNARVRIHMVPGSAMGGDPNLIVFVPESDDPDSKDFLAGQLVTAISFLPSGNFVEFGITNAVALTLQGTLEGNGVVIRFDAENSALRQVQFYGSDAPDSLRPRLYITSSTPADFDPELP